MMDQANEKKIEAINALSEGDKLFLSTYPRTLDLVLLFKKKKKEINILDHFQCFKGRENSVLAGYPKLSRT